MFSKPVKHFENTLQIFNNQGNIEKKVYNFVVNIVTNWQWPSTGKC